MSLREALERRKTVILKEPLIRKFQGQENRELERMTTGQRNLAAYLDDLIKTHEAGLARSIREGAPIDVLKFFEGYIAALKSVRSNVIRLNI